MRASQWSDQHTQLTPIYEKLGLFSVYDSVWFSAIYILLMLSLVGCIVPRLFVYCARRTRSSAEGAQEPLPAAAAPRARRRRHHSRDRGGVAEAEALPAGGRGRRGARRARLPPRGRQPAVPPVGADRAGRVRPRWAVRLQGRRHRGDQRRLRQHAEPVRRLPGRRLLQRRRPEAVRLHRGRLQRDLHPRGPRGRDGAQVRRRPELPEQPDARPSSSKKISVNHPLHIDGTDVFLLSHGYAPHITVRNADRDDRLLRAGGVPARGQQLPVVRGGEGARCRVEERAHPDRARGRVLSDVRLHQGQERRTVLGLPRRPQPRDLDARLHR